MTIPYNQAAAQYGDMPNPRWIYCHAELGRKPTLIEYIYWLGERQREFAKQSGDWPKWSDMVAELGPAIQLRFNTYLEERLNRLKSERVSGHPNTAL